LVFVFSLQNHECDFLIILIKRNEVPSIELYYSFICMFCRSLFVPFLLFLLTILLSVLLRFTDSAYPLGIFKSSYTHHVGRVKTKTQNSSSTQLLNNIIIIKTKVLKRKRAKWQTTIYKTLICIVCFISIFE
jgi:hypothetical protein